MLKIFIGEREKILERCRGATYTENIMYELELDRGLLNTARDFYYLYTDGCLGDKENIQRFAMLAETAPYNVYVILDKLDKKSAFYRICKKYIEVIGKIEAENTIADLAKRYAKDKEVIINIDDRQFVKFLYALYFVKSPYSLQAGTTLTWILEGKIGIQIAKRIFMLTTL